MLHPVLQPLLEHPVAVLGAGVSGRAATALLRSLGAEVALYDEKSPVVQAFAENAHRHRLVVFSPGFPPEHPWFTGARAAGCTCLSELDLAALCWRGRLWAVTGTNGKSTTVELLAAALRGLGREATATGNVGHAFSQLVLDTHHPAAFAVVEISSFQAETLAHLRPEALVWTNFAEDHLDRHGTLERYFAAKWHLVERGDGCLFVTDTGVAAHAARHGHELPPETVIVDTSADPGDPLLEGTIFAAPPQSANYLLARALWRHSGLPEAALAAAAVGLPPRPHRLVVCGRARGVTFWNDSKGTNFHAVLGALAAVPGRPLWIGGGRGKGGDLRGFARDLAPRIRKAFLIGETGNELAAHLEAFGTPIHLSQTLGDAVEDAAEAAVAGDHILFSPGFASFDQFRNYEHRGEQFERLVRSLLNRHAPPTAQS